MLWESVFIYDILGLATVMSEVLLSSNTVAIKHVIKYQIGVYTMKCFLNHDNIIQVTCILSLSSKSRFPFSPTCSKRAIFLFIIKVFIFIDKERERDFHTLTLVPTCL